MKINEAMNIAACACENNVKASNIGTCKACNKQRVPLNAQGICTSCASEGKMAAGGPGSGRYPKGSGKAVDPADAVAKAHKWYGKGPGQLSPKQYKEWQQRTGMKSDPSRTANNSLGRENDRIDKAVKKEHQAVDKRMKDHSKNEAYHYDLKSVKNRLAKGQKEVRLFLPNDGRVVKVTNENYDKIAKLFQHSAKHGTK